MKWENFDWASWIKTSLSNVIVVSHHFTSSTALIRGKNFGNVILGLMGSNLKESNMEKLWQFFGFYWHSPGNSGSDPVYLILQRNMYLYVFSVIVIVCLLFQQQTAHVQLTELQVVNDGQVLTAHRLMLLLRYSVSDLLLWEWWIRYSQWPVLCRTLPYYICYTQSSYQWDIRRHLSFSKENITSEQEVRAMRMNVHCVVLVCTVNWAILWHGILCWRLFLHITYFSLGWIPCVSVLHVHVDIYG